jgi:CheY-like chemotaxis protein
MAGHYHAGSGTSRECEYGVARLTGVRVLLVDDHVDTIETLALALQTQGAQVRLASMATEALEALRDFHPHVLVSDLAMPVVDGYALIEKVRALPADQGGRIPALAVTAHAYTPLLDRATRMGFTDTLAKPVEPSTLIEAVARLTARVAV